MDFVIPEWSYAYGGPSGKGEIKTTPDDFIVEEMLPFSPDGSGEHVFLQIEKSGENTEYLARILARFAGVRQRDIGFAGLKDRQARTTQWFSVWLPGKVDPEWAELQTENIKLLKITRHARKLKRGVIEANQFKILIRNWQGESLKAENQLQLIKKQGFPNYFGEQRFGRNGQNVNKALALFQGEKVKREQKSIYLSAARAYLFNLILAHRVSVSTWNQLIPGDVCQLNHSKSVFKIENLDSLLHERVMAGDVHPTAILWGDEQGIETSADAGRIEKINIDKHQDLREGLIKFGASAERRALRVMPEQLNWQIKGTIMQLSFKLPPGSYATALLRELLSN